MCGIFGGFTFGKGNIQASLLDEMANSISHRGPDASDHFSDDNCSVGNCRLSIIDLSSASNQPLFSKNKQIILVQNGAIYNYIELREELKKFGAHFETSGDTEVLLRAYEHWGVEFAKRLNGMFTIAIYDIQQKNLLLYRDRLGVKPLFISGGKHGKPFWFASEIKALLKTDIKPTVNMNAIAQYFALNYIPPPATAFEGIYHLPPGHMAKINVETGVTLHQYWDLTDINPESNITEAEAKSEFLSLLDNATQIRMRSDAKFGAFLSGGLDSSSIVGMMSLYQSEGIKSFCIGFDDPRFDERSFAQIAANRFGAQHRTEVMSNDGVDKWPRFIWHSEQPHGDVSFMPTDQVSSLAAKDVKMVLTGDGGDELFAGYEKYLKLFPDGKINHLRSGWENQYVKDSGLLIGTQSETLLSHELHEAFFDSNPYKPLSDMIKHAQHHDPINRVMFAETTTLLPGNNLVKPDRMAMANSLEVRSPFLDYRMVEFAFKVPGALKLANGETKSIYKRAMEPMLGNVLTYRKKKMFTVPIGEWFRKSLANYCKEILQDGRLSARNIVDDVAVDNMIKNHIAGTDNNSRQLRALISLEIWFRLFIDQDSTWIDMAQTNKKAA